MFNLYCDLNSNYGFTLICDMNLKYIELFI